jgi:hypothetical protein
MLLSIFGLSLTLVAQNVPRSLLILIGGGSPGSTEFSLNLSDDGILRVTKKALPITQNGKLTELTVSEQLSISELDRIFLLAKNATDFSMKSSQPVADGANAGMRLCLGTETIRRDCSNAPKWPVGRATKSLLTEINKHLSKEMRLF